MSAHPTMICFMYSAGRSRSCSAMVEWGRRLCTANMTSYSSARVRHAQFAASQGKTGTIRSVIMDHRDTWITEADFSLMASVGINAVRVPIGYWVLATSQVTARCSHCPARLSPTRTSPQASALMSHASGGDTQQGPAVEACERAGSGWPPRGPLLSHPPACLPALNSGCLR